MKPNHDSLFCDKFLNDKKEVSSSPSISESFDSVSPRNFSNCAEIKIEDDKTKKNLATSKLLKFKNHVLRALKNRRITRTLTKKTEVNSFHSAKQLNLDHLPPLVINNVKMFVTKIRKAGYLNNLTTLRPFDLKIINDYSHVVEENQRDYSIKRNHFLYYFFRLIVHFFDFPIFSLNIPLIHPYNKFKLLWDVFIYIVTIFLMFFIPFEIAFQSEVIEIYGKYFSCALLLDMFFEMNTLSFLYGSEVRNRKQIFFNYWKSYFFPDLIALMSIICGSKEFLGGSFMKHMTLFFFSKIFTLMKVSKRLMNRFQIRYQWKGIKNLIILFLVIFLITHITACGWFYIGNVSVSTPDEKNWIKAQSLIDQSWYIKYMSSFYWSSVTVMTVGYGDITPQNYIERFYCLCVILLGCMILPYSINSIGFIIQDINREHTKFE